MTRVRDDVRAKALLAGDDGRRWLDGLDETLAELEREWGIELGEPYDGGTESYVARAVTKDGEEAVLKLVVPGGIDVEGEATVLEAGQGHGYVRLLATDLPRRALLLERLGPRLADEDLPLERKLEIICERLRAAWEAPPVEGLVSGAEKAEALAEWILRGWGELGRPCSERVIGRALVYAERRAAAFDPAGSRLLHGDVHDHNTLQTLDGSGYRLVDPDGVFGEPAYDLAIPMREWAEPLLAGDPLALGRERCARLSKLTGVAEEPIWEWGFVERVSTGLLALQVGKRLGRAGREALAVAEAWARA